MMKNREMIDILMNNRKKTLEGVMSLKKEKVSKISASTII